MTKTKVLSLLTASMLSASCLGAMTASAEIYSPECYQSIMTNVSEDILLLWEESTLNTLGSNGISSDDHEITFSEPYYSYEFYNMICLGGGSRIVFVDGEVYGKSSCQLSSYVGDVDHVFTQTTEFEDAVKDAVSDALENDKTILFGRASIDLIPTGIICADGVIYAVSSFKYPEGTTDLVFGEFPYCESTETEYDEDGNPIVGTGIVGTITEGVNVYGDVDMDGIITGHDAGMVSRYLLEEDYPLTDEQLSLADINGDGEVTQTDADEIFGMQAYELGKVVLDDVTSYRHLDDVTEILLYYARNGAGMETPFSDIQKNLADMDLNGTIDLQDVSMCLGLYAMRGARLIGSDEVIDGVYYYSEDPASPAYIGDLYWTNIKDGAE